MKKYEFDNEPQMLEQEGSMMRISFDVEQAVVPIPSMSGEPSGERTIYKASVVRVPIPLNAANIIDELIAAGCDELHAEVVAREAMFVLGGSKDLEQAKALVIAKITEYDSSSAVNEFTYNDIPMWLPDAKRTQLAKRFETDELDGLTETKMIYGGIEITLPIATAKTMLHQLESYARDCFDNMNAHKASVAALTTVKKVLAYDYTTGYPPKLAF